MKFLLVILVNFAFIGLAYGGVAGEKPQNPSVKKNNAAFAINKDMAFISIYGSRPDAKQLQGFQRAVLFNARGEIVQKLDMKNDSIYSLDKMIQENKSKGPLIIKMYR